AASPSGSPPRRCCSHRRPWAPSRRTRQPRPRSRAGTPTATACCRGRSSTRVGRRRPPSRAGMPASGCSRACVASSRRSTATTTTPSTRASTRTCCWSVVPVPRRRRCPASTPTATAACSSPSTCSWCGAWRRPRARRRRHELRDHSGLAAGDSGTQGRAGRVLGSQQGPGWTRLGRGPRRAGGVHRARRGGNVVRGRDRRRPRAAAAAPAHLLLSPVLRRQPAGPAADRAVRDPRARSAPGAQRRDADARVARPAGRTREQDARSTLHRRPRSRRFHLHRLFATRPADVRVVVRRREVAAAGPAATRHCRPFTTTRTFQHGDSSMKYRNSLLSLAIVSALAVGSTAFAAQPGAGTDADAVLAAKAAAVARAQALVDGPARQLVHRASADGFTAEVTAVQIDDDGTEHVRFKRTYKGDLPVIGGDFVLHSRNGKVLGASQSLPTSKRPSTSPSYSSKKAIAKAIDEFGMAYSEAPNSRLVLYALTGTPRLAHEVVLRGVRADQTPTEMHYFVDARNGKLLDQWDEVQTARPGRDGGGCASPVAAEGTGHSLTQGTVEIATVECAKGYQMMDLSRGGGYTTN